MSLPTSDIEQPSPAPETAAEKPVVPRLMAPRFNRAGAPSIADLGFDAEAGSETAEAGAFDQAADDLIGFPGERIPHISFGFEGERWRIRNVVWVVAQSPTGLSLIEHTYRAGYRLGFDGMTATSEKLGGSVNPVDKVITLDSRASLEQMVAQLSFLLGLGSAAIDGVSYDITMNPSAALQAGRLANAYALALQIQVAYELNQATTLPPNADREAYWRQAVAAHPRLTSAYAQMAINEMAISQGAAMAAALREFYDFKTLRDSYDTEVINFYQSIPPMAFKDPKLMNTGFDVAAMIYKLRFPSVTYAVAHDPKLLLTDPVNSSSCAAIAEAVAALQAVRKNAGVKDRDPWHVSVA